MTKNSKLSAPADVEIPFCDAPCGHSSQYCYTENGGKNIICLLCERLERAFPSRGNEAPHNSVTVRFGFGEFDLSTLKEDEFVTASGLNDGGWVVCKRLPSTPEETGLPRHAKEKCPACICYEHLLHLIQLAVCDPREAAKGNMPSKAKAVEMIIDRANRVPPSPSPEYFASGYKERT